MNAKLNSLWKRGTEFLGTRYAIMGGAMSWVSERNLVAALSNSGAFGVIANGSMPPELLEKEIIETKKLTSKPFGVNLIIMHPLPRRAEIEVAVDDDQRAMYWRQERNGMWIRAALIAYMFGVEKMVLNYSEQNHY